MAANVPVPDQSQPKISVEAIRANPADQSQGEFPELAERESSMYREKLRGYGQDIDERKKYAHRTFCLISCWLAGVFLLLLFQGFDGTVTSHFQLEKTVLITVVGTTTASVLGIFIVVMHYLFPAKGQDEK